MEKYHKNTNLLKIENFISENEKIEVKEKAFSKVMFIYSVAIKELLAKLEIIKEEFKLFYDYELIDHINTRIKQPESILKK